MSSLDSILITGSRGQLGRALMHRLASQAVPYNRPEGDLTDVDALRAALQRHQPRLVINCAAYTLVDHAESEQDRCLAVNATAVEQLAQHCRAADIPLLQISTDYVFGGDATRNQPYREDDRPQPLSIYGWSKLRGEQAAAQSPRHWIVRTCGLYAYGPQPTNFIEKILALAATRDRLTVVHDQRCSPTYVEHLADALLELVGIRSAVMAPFGIYHVVNQGEVTWYELACELMQQAGLRTEIVPITSAQFGAPAKRPGYSVLACDKFHALGYTPLPHWRMALAEYLRKRG